MDAPDEAHLRVVASSLHLIFARFWFISVPEHSTCNQKWIQMNPSKHATGMSAPMQAYFSHDKVTVELMNEKAGPSFFHFPVITRRNIELLQIFTLFLS